MRVDFYGTIHKALRAKLFDTSVELARTDFGTEAEVAVATAAYRRTVDFLREHHGHEERFVEPLIASRATDAVTANRAQHEAIEVMLGGLDAMFLALEGARGGESNVALGRNIVAHYDDFLAAYLGHMRHEETVMQAAFWEHCTDEELLDTRAKVQAAIPPARFAEWLAIILPALNVDERAAMFRGLSAGAPPAVLQGASDVALRVLGQSGWSAVRARAAI